MVLQVNSVFVFYRVLSLVAGKVLFVRLSTLFVLSLNSFSFIRLQVFLLVVIFRYLAPSRELYFRF